MGHIRPGPSIEGNQRRGLGVDVGLEDPWPPEACARLDRFTLAKPERKDDSIFVTDQGRVQDSILAVRVNAKIEASVECASPLELSLIHI